MMSTRMIRVRLLHTCGMFDKYSVNMRRTRQRTDTFQSQCRRWTCVQRFDLNSFPGTTVYRHDDDEANFNLHSHTKFATPGVYALWPQNSSGLGMKQCSGTAMLNS